MRRRNFNPWLTSCDGLSDHFRSKPIFKKKMDRLDVLCIHEKCTFRIQSELLSFRSIKNAKEYGQRWKFKLHIHTQRRLLELQIATTIIACFPPFLVLHFLHSLILLCPREANSSGSRKRREVIDLLFQCPWYLIQIERARSLKSVNSSIFHGTMPSNFISKWKAEWWAGLTWESNYSNKSCHVKEKSDMERQLLPLSILLADWICKMTVTKWENASIRLVRLDKIAWNFEPR